MDEVEALALRCQPSPSQENLQDQAFYTIGGPTRRCAARLQSGRDWLRMLVCNSAGFHWTPRRADDAWRYRGRFAPATMGRRSPLLQPLSLVRLPGGLIVLGGVLLAAVLELPGQFRHRLAHGGGVIGRRRRFRRGGRRGLRRHLGRRVRLSPRGSGTCSGRRAASPASPFRSRPPCPAIVRGLV